MQIWSSEKVIKILSRRSLRTRLCTKPFMHFTKNIKTISLSFKSLSRKCAWFPLIVLKYNGMGHAHTHSRLAKFLVVMRTNNQAYSYIRIECIIVWCMSWIASFTLHHKQKQSRISFLILLRVKRFSIQFHRRLILNITIITSLLE